MKIREAYTAAILACSLSLVMSAQTDRVPAGTEITVRTNDSIDAKNANDGRIYTAVVDRDVMDQSGQVVIPKGSSAEMIVRNTSDQNLTLDLQSVNVNGRRYVVSTADEPVDAES